MRTELSTKKIPEALNASNITNYSIQWQDGGVDIKHKDHEAYLSAFTEQFVNDMKRLINGGVYQKENLIPASEYYTGKNYFWLNLLKSEKWRSGSS